MLTFISTLPHFKVIRMMNRMILLTIWTLSTTQLCAQWTPTDSLWLQNVLTGKEELRLNEETMRAIRSGSLINLGNPSSSFLQAPLEFPLARTFGIKAESIKNIQSGLNPDSLDPYLYFKYSFIFADLPPIVEKKPIPGFDMRGVNFTKNPLNPVEANRGVTIMQTYGERPFEGISVRVTMDFNDLLSRIFSPTYRRRMYNREHANAWRTYNSGDSLTVKQED
jgi:hypothetical protein